MSDCDLLDLWAGLFKAEPTHDVNSSAGPAAITPDLPPPCPPPPSSSTALVAVSSTTSDAPCPSACLPGSESSSEAAKRRRRFKWTDSHGVSHKTIVRGDAQTRGDCLARANLAKRENERVNLLASEKNAIQMIKGMGDLCKLRVKIKLWKGPSARAKAGASYLDRIGKYSFAVNKSGACFSTKQLLNIAHDGETRVNSSARRFECSPKTIRRTMHCNAMAELILQEVVMKETIQRIRKASLERGRRGITFGGGKGSGWDCFLWLGWEPCRLQFHFGEEQQLWIQQF